MERGTRYLINKLSSNFHLKKLFPFGDPDKYREGKGVSECRELPIAPDSYRDGTEGKGVNKSKRLRVKRLVSFKVKASL